MLVQEVMSTGVVTARRSDSVRSVVTKMLSRHCGAIPVVEDDELLIGMVTLRDVLIPLYPMGLKNFRRIPVVDKGRLVGMVSVGDVNRGLFFTRGHAPIEGNAVTQPSGR